MPEFDPGLQLYLGYACVIARNNKIMFEEMEKISGPDIPKLVDIGRAFALGSAVPSTEPDFTDSGDSTPEPSTQGLKSSKAGGF